MPLSEFISEENNHAANIKGQENILVVLGNPPYSGNSANTGKDIIKLLHGIDPLEPKKKNVPDYFKCDNKPLGERNPKMLNDDYVKFIRFAQWRIDRTGEGILGFITNHGYLDNPTFRGMRQALMQSFSEIHVLDLHGNDRKKEIDPTTGEKDENVFDIQQGVAIILAFKKKDGGPCRVFHADLFGKRAIRDSRKNDAPIVDGKYAWLWNHDVKNTEWCRLPCTGPRYLFAPLDETHRGEYSKFFALNELMPVYSNGCKTHRDEFCVSFDKNTLIQRVELLVNKDIDLNDACRRLGLAAQDKWRAREAREKLSDKKTVESCIQRYLYRPFDWRFIVYDGAVVDRPRFEVLRHLSKPHDNLALTATRQTRDQWDVVAINSLFDHKGVAAYDTNSAFPLYLYPAEGESDVEVNSITGRRPNFSGTFLETLARGLQMKRVLQSDIVNSKSKDGFVQYSGLPKGIGPEVVFYYLYAVLHSPGYRSRYAEFLKMDYPRLPVPGSLELFKALAHHGARICALFLLDPDKAPELNQMRHGFPIGGNSQVAAKFPKYLAIGDSGVGRVYINDKQYFDSIPEAVWLRMIGGYQVADKWLKDRRGRALTADERVHYQRILIALAETQKEMEKIDETIMMHGGWPGAFFSTKSNPEKLDKTM